MKAGCNCSTSWKPKWTTNPKAVDTVPHSWSSWCCMPFFIGGRNKSHTLCTSRCGSAVFEETDVCGQRSRASEFKQAQPEMYSRTLRALNAVSDPFQWQIKRWVDRTVLAWKECKRTGFSTKYHLSASRLHCQPLWTPVSVKLQPKSDVDKTFALFPDTHKVRGAEGDEALRKHISTFAALNYVWLLSRVRHCVIQSTVLWSSETPRQRVVKVDYTTITSTQIRTKQSLHIHYHVLSGRSATELHSTSVPVLLWCFVLLRIK